LAYFEKCPCCGSDNVLGNRLQGFARFESCSFASTAREELLQAGPSSATSTTTPQPNTFSFDRFPSILTLPLKGYIEEPNPALKLWHACDIVEMTLRLLVVLGVADVRRRILERSPDLRRCLLSVQRANPQRSIELQEQGREIVREKVEAELDIGKWYTPETKDLVRALLSWEPRTLS
jgi:hypothetical protein